MPAQIDVYLKPGCPLCEAALDLLDAACQRFALVVTTHNILETTELFAQYRYAVPVIVVQGIERLRSRFDQQELEAALLASGCPHRE